MEKRIGLLGRCAAFLRLFGKRAAAAPYTTERCFVVTCDDDIIKSHLRKFTSGVYAVHEPYTDKWYEAYPDGTITKKYSLYKNWFQ